MLMAAVYIGRLSTDFILPFSWMKHCAVGFMPEALLRIRIHTAHILIYQGTAKTLLGGLSPKSYANLDCLQWSTFS